MASARSLAVLPSFQRQGIVARAVQAGLETCRSMEGKDNVVVLWKSGLLLPFSVFARLLNLIWRMSTAPTQNS